MSLTELVVPPFSAVYGSMRVVARWLNERNTHVLSVKYVTKLEAVLG